jgi:O-antigen ligase
VLGWAAFDEMRTVSYYLTFFIVTNLMRSRRQITTLLRGLLLLAVFVAIAMLAQFVLGKSLVILAGRVETLGTRYSDITRMLPPGESVLLVAFLALTTILVLDRPVMAHRARLIAWLLTGAAILLTFNRNFWFSVVLGLVLLGVVLVGEDRRRYIQWIVAIGIIFSMGAATLVVVVPETRVGRLATASANRFVTLINVSTYSEDRSLRDRLPEYEYTIPQIVSHPVLGIGMGASYRPYDSRLDWLGHNHQRYTHNAHLWLLMKSGLVGYLCMMWLSIVFLARALKHWRYIQEPELRGMVLGFAITYAGVLGASIVNPILMQYYWTPIIGLMMGLSELAIRTSMTNGYRQVARSDVA